MDVTMKGLVSDRDRHGNRRYYLRTPGRGKTRLREPFGTEAFLEELRCARLGIPWRLEASPAPVDPRDPTAQPGSLKWLSLEYLRRGCATLAPSTVTAKGYAFTAICDTPIRGKQTPYGRMPYAYLGSEDVEHLRDLRKHMPDGADYWIKQIGAMFAWAMATVDPVSGRKLATANPATGVKKFRRRSEGFHTWSLEEIKTYRQRHPEGSQADMAFKLFFYTALRVSDGARAGRQHLYQRPITGPDGATVIQTRLKLMPKKTGKRTGAIVDIEILPPLAAAIERLPRTQLLFLQSRNGTAYSDKSLSNMVRDWCDQAGLPHCGAHGLRKAFSTLMAEDGANDRQLMAWLGWSNTRQAETYTAAAERRRLADAGVKFLKPL